MKTLFKKTVYYLREKGALATVKKVAGVGLKNLAQEGKNPRKELGKQINIHNQSYFAISQLATKINNGIHPKHRIIGYHQFFLDNIDPKDSILDIGCGNGYLAFDMAKKAKEVIGIDIIPDNIAFAEKNYKKNNLKFVTADAANYSFNQEIDKIILSNVLEHIENRVNFLKKLHKISDTILLRVPLITRDWLASYKKELGLEYRLDKTHFVEYTPEELQTELAEAGWKLKTYQVNWGELWGVVKKITYNY